MMKEAARRAHYNAIKNWHWVQGVVFTGCFREVFRQKNVVDIFFWSLCTAAILVWHIDTNVDPEAVPKD